MAKGDCIYADFLYIKVVEPPKTAQLPNDCADCCYALPVFWSNEGNDLHQDKSSWVFFVDKSSVTGAVLALEKDGESVANLTTGSLGRLYPYGFIDNRINQKAIGYELNWNTVYTAHGNGKYRLKCTFTDVLGNEIVDYSPDFELRKYHPLLADETVRFEFNMNGQIGWFGESKVDFEGNDFYMQFRLPNSRFGHQTDDLSVENRRFESGATMQISKEIVNKYKLEVFEATQYILDLIQVTIRQAYYTKITGFHFCEKGVYPEKRVTFSNGSSPVVNNINDRGTVVFDLEEYFKNKITYR